jgi:hypothetical protein
LGTEAKSDVAEFLKPALLKKLFAIKDSFVQRSFYKMLSSLAKNLPGATRPLCQLTIDLAQEHIDEYSHYIRKGMSAADASTIHDFTDLLVNSTTGTTKTLSDLTS